MEMEGSISSLTYKGSIADAIAEAKRQKNIFLVHISGEDENSTLLKQSTWADQAVVESISRHCIFLHLIQGGIEALQFSAIYQQKSVPSITAVGYNGVMLWQHEGYISAEGFVRAIEKAWASLHFQKTAATLLSAALASAKPECLNSSSEDVAQVNSSSDVASTSANEHLSSLENRASNNAGLSVENMDSCGTDDKEPIPGPETSSHSDQVDDVTMHMEEETISACRTNEDVLLPVTRDMHTSTFNTCDVPTAANGNLTVHGSRIATSPVSHGSTDISGPGSVQVTSTEAQKSITEEVDGPTEGSDVLKSDDIYLNIRLPNGGSLQRKFTMTDTLRSVKNYVDGNQQIGSYDLAVPYPRKVFNEQDMDIILSELGFAGRQALIVVPRRQASTPQRGLLSSSNSQNSAREVELIDENIGYFGFVRRVFSYVNPFSYLPGNASSSNTEPAQSSVFRRPYGQSDQNSSGNGDAGETRRTSRPFGSNIHTLRRDDDDLPSRDRNTFWNGNSTQYGGDNDKK